MKEKWTGTLVGKMHNYGITSSDLAEEMNVTRSYVSMILNGARKPPMAKERLEDAFKAVLAKKVSADDTV